MHTSTPVRIALLLSIAAPLWAQTKPVQTRPAQIGPTSAPVQPAATLPATAPTATEPANPTPAQSPANRAKVTYVDHQLAITADNSSLNQILHDVSQLAGVTITGGVADERVFGNYGPDNPLQVLNQLLDGTNCNVLFIAATTDERAQLILTPRNGAPTPPNPNAVRPDENADADDQAVNPPEPPPIEPEPRPALAPNAGTASGAAPAPQNGAQNGTQASPANPGDSGDQNPNGVRTPQQIYDQLMKLRQQQQQQPH
jgi:hypothetical protein